MVSFKHLLLPILLHAIGTAVFVVGQTSDPFAGSANSTDVISAFNSLVQSFINSLTVAQRAQLASLSTNTALTKAQWSAAFKDFAGQLTSDKNQTALDLAAQFESLKAGWLSKLVQISPTANGQAVFNAIKNIEQDSSLTPLDACGRAQDLIRLNLTAAERKAVRIPANWVLMERLVIPTSFYAHDCQVMGRSPFFGYYLNIGQPDESVASLGGQEIYYSDYPFVFRSMVDNGTIDLGKLSQSEKIDINRRIVNATFAYYERYSQLVGAIDPNVPLVNQIRGSFNGSGDKKILVLGNSHADMIALELKDRWNNVYSHMDVFTVQGCLPFDIHYAPNDSLRWNNDVCLQYTQSAIQLAQQLKPEIVFIQFYWDTLNLTFDWSSGVQPPLATPIESDVVLQGLQNGVNNFANISGVKMIYLSAPSLTFPYATASELGRRLWAGTKLSELNLKLEDHLTRTRDNQIRLRNLKCPKCVIMDWTKPFCNNKGICLAYDPVGKISHLNDNIHWTFHGARLVGPYLKELADKVETELKWIEKTGGAEN